MSTFSEEIAVRSHVVVGECGHVIVGNGDPILNEKYTEVAVDLVDSCGDQPLAEVFWEPRHKEDERRSVSVVGQLRRCRRVYHGGVKGRRTSKGLGVESWALGKSYLAMVSWGGTHSSGHQL